MKIRVENVIETLKRLPAPTREGEVIQVPILKETWAYEFDFKKGSIITTTEEMKFLYVEADVVRAGSPRLEWFIKL